MPLCHAANDSVLGPPSPIRRIRQQYLIRDAPNLPRSLAVCLTAPALQQDRRRGLAMAEQAFCFVLGGILPLAGVLWLFCH